MPTTKSLEDALRGLGWVADFSTYISVRYRYWTHADSEVVITTRRSHWVTAAAARRILRLARGARHPYR